LDDRLPRAERDLGSVKLTTMDGRPMTFGQALEETYADGIAVLHRGRIVFERYFGALEPHKQHIAMSVTKSFTGVLAGILVAEGKLDPAAPVTASMVTTTISGWRTIQSNQRSNPLTSPPCRARFARDRAARRMSLPGTWRPALKQLIP